MDDIAPYRGASAPIAPSSRGAAPPSPYRPTPHGPAAAAPFGPDLAAVKTTGHYVGALRRRFWLALIVAVPMGTLTSIYALRQPKLYQAIAQIRIVQPHNDAALSALVARDVTQSDASTQASYAADMITDLQGRMLADRVVAGTRLGPELAQLDDPAMELIVNNISVKPVNKSNTYYVYLTGRDPALTKRLLEAELDELVKYAQVDQQKHVDDTVEHARKALNELRRESAAMEKSMLDQITTLGTIGPGGRNILDEQYTHISQSIAQQQARVAELQQKMMFAPLFPKDDMVSPAEARKMQQLDRLQDVKDQLVDRLTVLKRKTRHFNSDPAVQTISNQLNDVLDEIDELGASYTKSNGKMAADPTEMIHDSLQREVDAADGRRQELLVRLQKAMPDHQKFLTLMDERGALRKRIAEMEHDLASFELLAKSQGQPVTIKGRIEEPTTPKSSRTVTMALGLVFSLGLGLGLVFLLEYLDHSVRVPEHVSHGLGLPLLGIVPRIPRTALTHRGGHLWTSAVPDSAAADAFRNIRAGLLGAADRLGPIVSLLVTSAKAGDGKSTAALNLAAACARAGERTLLLDVDLRRPTLAGVFPAEDDEEGGPGLGLVDVLKGSVPWQATLRRTDLHNLDFIPTGDTREVPIEILGTLELRQLLAAVTHHYDRVILDGPAILGMADCRVLGRMVDAAMLVVRAGAHQTMTLQRAKAVLEQSHVEIAGVIVNGLSEGVQNWSSYGYGPTPMTPPPRRDRALAASSTSPAREDALAGAPADA
ncbi:exopolysaccharide transport family protein [Paludisphaera mucosa]|uniref:Polysaccharide biosynthesis tyrosine autokinase n=1 Tax=Paludisphaera mucosa TaxID=3030827 RepID=A0ABT6FJQ9_9BACT|nr:polysaccharide biosynthesis tyrosine autokinase [Paludisphaera mucosa]MDG3007588.1 polysaccharide biosynthesis tyrosine autokinase [Paludisphaera mucosa]